MRRTESADLRIRQSFAGIVLKNVILQKNTLRRVDPGTASSSVKDISELTAVNFTAPLLLTNLFLRDLKNRQGHLLFLSSVTAAKTNNTHGCAYGATKAGISNFAKSLFEEVRKYGVRVTVLAPDMTRTNLYRNASFCAAEDTDAALTPEEVAEYALFALTARDGLNLTELTMQPQRHRLERKRC